MKTRIGRPLKPVTAKRVSLGLKVSAETKGLIDALAFNSGLTQSQAAERLIERAIQYDRLIAAAIEPPGVEDARERRIAIARRLQEALGEVYADASPRLKSTMIDEVMGPPYTHAPAKPMEQLLREVRDEDA